MTRSIKALSLLAICLVAARLADAAEPVQRTVSTQGVATVYVQPDEIELRFAIETYDKDLAAAKQKNDASAAKVLEAVRAAGVEDQYVQTTAVRSEGLYNWINEDGRSRRGELISYMVQRSYAIRMKDLTRFDGLIERLLTDTNVSGLSHAFRSSKTREHRDAARIEALRAAREKAAAMAAEYVCAIGHPITITETPEASWSFGGGMSNANFAAEMRGGGGGGAEAASPDVPTQLGQLMIRSEVSVVFELIPRDKN